MCAAAAAAESQHTPSAEAGSRVVAYVQGGSIPAVIHAEKLTHINFSFARIDAGRALLDQPGVADDLAKLRALKKQNPKLKVIVSVGGWLADGFSDAALTDSSRRTFARSAVALLREYALDGIDLDWEYPGQGVAGIKYRAEDKQNFTLLLKTLREEFDAESDTRGRAGSGRYILTIATADREYFDHVEMSKLHVYVDWINEMAYDFFNSLTSTTGHQAGLYPSQFSSATDRNGDAAVKQYLAAGVPSAKIVLGVPFYGRGFAGVTSLNNGIKQPYEHYEGDHSYDELVGKFIGKQGFVRYWDEHAQAPYLWNSASRTFISYDDPQSIANKVCYVRERHLGGMMFWDLGSDRNDELLNAIAGGCSR
ncbi:MAG: Chitinase [Gammaproteobacteria bacterium]|nr:Chitinase [Gammaproteobacteria bacterium]